ncbi:cupredoxin family copper-binding protein [Candidatus Daviesbacteria bacterium]|nr:cupredoxin family copper-binding protein [Candidatus Daviesbacteria bacterium]
MIKIVAFLTFSIILTITIFGTLAKTALAGNPTVSPISATVVNIQNSQFLPQQINIAAGETITWVNQDSIEHTTTSDDINAAESWGSGTLVPGQSFSKMFTKPGVYNYHCSVHPSMRGTVVVMETTRPPTTSPPSQLPKTGTPLETLFILAGLLPLGLKLMRFSSVKTIRKQGQYLWQERQFKIT